MQLSEQEMTPGVKAPLLFCPIAVNRRIREISARQDAAPVSGKRNSLPRTRAIQSKIRTASKKTFEVLGMVQVLQYLCTDNFF